MCCIMVCTEFWFIEDSGIWLTMLLYAGREGMYLRFFNIDSSCTTCPIPDKGNTWVRRKHFLLTWGGLWETNFPAVGRGDLPPFSIICFPWRIFCQGIEFWPISFLSLSSWEIWWARRLYSSSLNWILVGRGLWLCCLKEKKYTTLKNSKEWSTTGINTCRHSDLSSICACTLKKCRPVILITHQSAGGFGHFRFSKRCPKTFMFSSFVA